MEAAPVVIALSDSPRLRETLSVLLEHECDLRSLRPTALHGIDPTFADLAVVALSRPLPFLQDLASRCPALPVINIDLKPRSTAGGPIRLRQSRVRNVPLEPHAIRAAVMRELARQPDGPLRTTVRWLAHTLQAEISYPLVALRALCAAPVRDAAPGSEGVLAAVIREQVHVLSEVMAALAIFQERPRDAELGSGFAPTLCQDLERADRLTTERGVLWELDVDTDAAALRGPLGLTSTITALLHAHLRRRAASPVIRVRASSTHVEVRYTARVPGAGVARSWPLLLVALTLRPSGWEVDVTHTGDDEAIRMRPPA